MNIHTLSLSVSAPRGAVFNFLADIENLPKWATDWCESIALSRGRWWALTAEGEMVVDFETSAGTGVIDLRAGPLPESMLLTPIRVVPLSARRTLISITVIEAPDRGPEVFTQRCELWRAALHGLLRRFGGGELHSQDAAPQLLELGLN